MSDERTPNTLLAAVGKRIEIARRNVNSLHLVFTDGTGIEFFDNAQECCEHRYMTCDDDLQSFTGSTFVGMEVLEAPCRNGEANCHDTDCHDVQFLHVRTSSGTIVCETHNEHNGCYGGFDVVVREVPA